MTRGSRVDVLGKLLRSMRWTRPSQLFHRLRLEGVRRWRCWRARRGAVEVGQDLPMRELPSAALRLIGDRSGLVGGVPADVRVAGQAIRLGLPMDWEVEWVEVGRPLVRLSVHYLEFLSELGDAAFVSLSRDWVRQNPAYQPGYWRDSWNSFGLSIRVVVWMRELSARSVGVVGEHRGFLVAEVVRQMRFLVRHLEVDLGGNHLLKNIRALLWAGRCFEGGEPERWGRLGRKLLRRELREQMLPDGFHYERSVPYQAQIFMDLLDCFVVLDSGGDAELRADLAVWVDRALQVIVDLQQPHGVPCLFNDGGESYSWSPAECCEAYSRVFEREAPQPRSEFAFPDGGIWGIRFPGEVFVVDWGVLAPDFLPAHAHGDIGSFEWTVGGRQFVVDAGVYEYAAGEWRTWSRSTRMHNTVTLEDLDQAEFWSSFRMGRRPRRTQAQCAIESGRLDLCGSHDGYRHLRGRPIHHRKVVATAGCVDVSDEIRGGAGQVAVARLLLHPEVSVESKAAGLVLWSGDVRVELEAPAVEVSCVDAWWCPDFNVKHATRQVEIWLGAAPCSAKWRLRRVDLPAV